MALGLDSTARWHREPISAARPSERDIPASGVNTIRRKVSELALDLGSGISDRYHGGLAKNRVISRHRIAEKREEARRASPTAHLLD